MPPSADAIVRPASTILLLRDAPRFEVLMVERHRQIEFASGALVFPGGKTHAGDLDPAWADHALGWREAGDEQRALRVAAIREVFEEAGVLLARDARGGPLDMEPCPLDLRQAVDRGEIPFLDVVRQAGARIDLAALTVFARWITPAFAAKRFDTWFYVAHAPEGQLAACDGRETVDACWLTPGEALEAAESGRRKVVFPTRMNLMRLAEAKAADEAIAQASARPPYAVEPQVEERPEGKMLVLPEAAGYGPVAEPLASVL